MGEGQDLELENILLLERVSVSWPWWQLEEGLSRCISQAFADLINPQSIPWGRAITLLPDYGKEVGKSKGVSEWWDIRREHLSLSFYKHFGFQEGQGKRMASSVSVATGKTEVMFQCTVSPLPLFAWECCLRLQKVPLCCGHPSLLCHAFGCPALSKTLLQFENVQIYDPISPGRSQQFIFPFFFFFLQRERGMGLAFSDAPMQDFD